MMTIHPLTHDHVVRVVGHIDDDKIAAIIATGATVDELVEAFAWASDETDVLGEARCSLRGRVSSLVDILTADDEMWREDHL